MLDQIEAGLTGRAVTAELGFAKGGGRTFLKRQSVPYPFHITRPHYLDPAAPDLATLYLQSASGGLYPGDRLDLAIGAAPGARAHVTSQAATVVNGLPGGLARDRSRVATAVSVADGAFLALTTDPYILFPGTNLSVETELRLGAEGAAIIAEGFATHDPSGAAQTFTRLEMATRVIDVDDRVLVEDRGVITGAEFLGARSPLGPYRAMGGVLILGRAALDLDPARIDRSLDAVQVLAGATRLPNDAGLAVRLLAADGGRLATGLELAFAIGFEALTGQSPACRRK